MEEYGELLKDPRWRQMRKQVLIRDGYKCVRCGNWKLVKDFSVGHISRKDNGELQIHELKTGSELWVRCWEWCSASSWEFNEVNIGISAGFRFCYRIMNVYDNLNFNKEKDYIVYYLGMDDCQGLGISPMSGILMIVEIDKGLFSFDNVLKKNSNAILTKEFIIDAKVIYSKNLHVHHSFYLNDKLPWEYPMESLETLCENCHAEEHNDESIIRFKKKKNDSDLIIFGCEDCEGSGLQPNEKLCPNCGGNGFYEA